MRILINPVFDIETLALVQHDGSYEYVGPICMCKGDPTAQAAAQLGITQQNEALKQANYWNSINVLSGQAATANPLGYANSATSGSGAVADLSKAVTAANGPTLGAVLGGVAGGALQGWGANG